MEHEEPRVRGGARAGPSKRTRGPDPNANPETSSGSNDWQAKALGGDPPPFNDWTSWVRNPEGSRIFMYGGVRSNSEISCSDFYCLDFETKKWNNLTNALLRINVHHGPCKSKKEKLPILDHPAMAFLSAHGRNFITLFGGDNDGRAVSSLIVIDVDHNIWWEANPDDGAVTARMNAAAVGIGSRLYIFGGYEGPLATVSLQSYCVAEYDANGEWKWIVRDRPYPANLPVIPGIDAVAVSLYGGERILLAPGRETKESFINFSRDNMTVFHVQNETFHVAGETTGSFPRDVRWLQMYVMDDSVPMNQAGDKRKRNTGPDQLAVLIVAWIPYGEEDLIPEIWRYLPSPDEKLTCLNLRKKVWDLDLDLQSIAPLGGCLFLLGQREKSLVWNTYVDITDAINTN